MTDVYESPEYKAFRADLSTLVVKYKDAFPNIYYLVDVMDAVIAELMEDDLPKAEPDFDDGA